jgi:hypothetical protein
MNVSIGQKIKHKGKSWIVRKIEGDRITLRCAVGCPATLIINRNDL